MHQERIDSTTTQVEPVLPHSMGNKCRGEDYWQTMLRWIWKTYLVEALVLNPARAQVRAAVRGGKEAGAWRRVLLPPESGCPLCKRWLQPEREGTGGKSPSLKHLSGVKAPSLGKIWGVRTLINHKNPEFYFYTSPLPETCLHICKTTFYT